MADTCPVCGGVTVGRNIRLKRDFCKAGHWYFTPKERIKTLMTPKKIIPRLVLTDSVKSTNFAEVREDKMPYNELAPKHAELLALLVEEMGEAIQAIGEILRHGLESHHPSTNEINRAVLEREIGDVRAATLMLCDAKILSQARIQRHADIKRENVKKHLHEQ